MHLSAGEVHVWLASLDGDDAGDQAELLAPEELERAARMGSPSGRSAFIAGRATLRAILSRYVPTAPAALQIATGPHGKPFLAGGGDLRFNLSHSASSAALSAATSAATSAVYAVTRGREVGVDLERLDRQVPYLRLARRFFSDHEVEQLDELPESRQRRAFFAGWVRKEALVKAWGTGLSTALDQFDVCLLPDRPPRLLAVRNGLGGAARWTLCDVDYDSGHACALAVEAPLGRLSVRRWVPGAAAPLPKSR